MDQAVSGSSYDEKELASKFLSGEMSFAEYSSEWYAGDEEEGEEAVKSENEPRQPTQRGPKTRRYGIHLTPALQGLMGEANLRFVRGDRETAEKMCHEIIKQVPNAPEPYQTLAQIYEDDNEEKALQFSLLAAHLRKTDANEWVRLATLCEQKNNLKQATVCYRGAIKADPHNLDLHLKRLELALATEDKYFRPERCYNIIVASLPASKGEKIMEYMNKAVALYNANNEIELAIEVMDAAYKKCPSLFTLENINIFLEMLMSKKQYKASLEVFVASVGVEVEAEIQTVKNADNEIEEQTTYTKCTIPNDLPIDLKSKLLVCFIHLGATDLVQTLLNDFLSNDVEKAGDLYMDIEEALSSVGHHMLAMKLLKPLVENTNFNLGGVWLKHAECLYNLGKEDEAIESYYKVLKHAPQHPDARRKLFTLLEKKGCIDQALDILQQDYKYVVSAALLYEQCCVLNKYNQKLKYLQIGEDLLSKNFARYRSQDELRFAFRVRLTVDLIHNFRASIGENIYHNSDLHFDEEENFSLTSEQEWNLLKELLDIALANKLYHVMQRLTFSSTLSKGLVPYRQDIEFLALQACILNKDFDKALKFARELASKHPNTCTWNILNYVIGFVSDCTSAKFFYRLFQKDNVPVKKLFLGNNFLTSGRNLIALKYYLEYHEQNKEPMSALLIAITTLVMAAQRRLDKHQNIILQGLSYLMTYKNLRKCDQESFYNIGRAYQMITLNNLAIEYYEKALKCGPVTVCEKHGVIDLSKEIAYNLVILYKDHSPHMARKYMHEYLVIE